MFPVRIILKYDFRFAEHQEKTAYGLGYELTLTKIKTKPFSIKLRQSLRLELSLIVFSGFYPIIHFPVTKRYII